jgi:hypothetical protein
MIDEMSMDAAQLTAVAAGIQAGAAVFLLGATAWYAKLTRDISKGTATSVAEMRDQRLHASQPLVIVRTELLPPSSASGTTEWLLQNRLYLVVRNVGNGPAIHVEVSAAWGDLRYVPDNAGRGGTLVQPEIRRTAYCPLPYLLPGDEVGITVANQQGSGYRSLPADAPPLCCVATYQDIYRRRFSVTCVYAVSRDAGEALIDVVTVVDEAPPMPALTGKP